MVDFHNLAVTKSDVLFFSKDCSNWVRNLSGLESGCRYLIEQWQESVKVVLINNRDLHVFANEASCGSNSSETSTRNHNVR
jgi:hypothetical protein